MLNDLKVLAQNLFLIACGLGLAIMLCGCSMLKADARNYQQKVQKCDCAPSWGCGAFK